MKFEIKDKFFLNGEPVQLISGAFHYFRTVPEYWQDRLEKLRNMGCNTVETYIPWNFHEPDKGRFLWDGIHDIDHFLTLAEQLGLYIIIRPSPYICAEWEFGGLPAWLLKDRNMRLRCCYQPYLDAVRAYYEVLIPKLIPHQIENGGGIILMQLENEYGYYGNDTNYLRWMGETLRTLGVTVPFVTSDGPWSEDVFRSGCVESALPTGNFGSSVPWQFDQMKSFIGDNKPLMCMEFWIGWFDSWGEEHHTTSAADNCKELEALLQRGSLSFYMFEGGTNFGFMSGRPSGSKTGITTSYDYDAALTEDGRITEKYLAFKDLIGKYRTIEPVPLSTNIIRKHYGTIPLNRKTDLFSVLDQISTPVSSVYPLMMEDIGQNYGYVLYRTALRNDEVLHSLRLEGATDRAQCYHDRSFLCTAFGDELGNRFELSDQPLGGAVSVLVENGGRENFGTGIEHQRKGISGGIVANDHRCYNFAIYPLPLDEAQIDTINFDCGYTEGVPAFYEFLFQADECADTFVDLDGFGKGVVFINGFNLGRFWEIGPQKRLYLPAPLIHKGANRIIVFETEGKAAAHITLADDRE